MSAIIGLVIASFMFTDTGLYGTTTTDIPFRQYEICSEPRIEVFELNNKPLWIILEGKIIELKQE